MPRLNRGYPQSAYFWNANAVFLRNAFLRRPSSEAVSCKEIETMSNLNLRGASTERVIQILTEERSAILELRRHLMHTRTLLRGKLAPRIQELLDGLFVSITHCGDILSVRVHSLCFDSITGPKPAGQSEDTWHVVMGDATHCSEFLHSIQSAYAHCARTTAESMSAMAAVDDQESSAILRWISSTLKESLWFIEIYLEGLAVHMDCGQLPPAYIRTCTSSVVGVLRGR
jgi:hypothetical protein